MSQDDDDDSPRKNLPVLNVSERPMRNRKRNSRFFNDDEDTSWGNRSPRKRGGGGGGGHQSGNLASPRQTSGGSAASAAGGDSSDIVVVVTSTAAAATVKQEKSTSSLGGGTTTSTAAAGGGGGSSASGSSSSASGGGGKDSGGGGCAAASAADKRERLAGSGHSGSGGGVWPLVKTKHRVSSVQGPDRLAMSAASTRLKNFLKLPKAHKWVMYEFFYSNIDDCLFNQENEFSSYLKQSFPFLQTRQLTRTEWSRIRRAMGKPRRCSAAFFEEELRSLHEKRELVRNLQQRLIDKLDLVEHLPAEIPLSLVIGTKVMAYVHERDGIFVGTIDAVDTQGATYRVSFDRPEIGSLTCPDFEVLSLQRVERMPIEYFIQRPRTLPPPRVFFPSSIKHDGDPLLSSGVADSRLGSLFPIAFLTLIVTLTRVLSDKKRKIEKLKEMNSFAERSVLNRNIVSVPFKKRYAMLLLDLSQLNHDLEECLEGIHKFCEDIQPPPHEQQQQQHSMLPHSVAVRARGLEEAKSIVALSNGDPPMVENAAHLDLIQSLIVVLVQMKAATEKKQSTFELRSLQDAITELQRKVSPRVMTVYENEVEVHLLHVQQLLTKKAEKNLRHSMQKSGGGLEESSRK